MWLYATVEGVGSARQLDRLCGEHVAYQWICGGVGVNDHTLSDLRVRNGEELDALLTQSVAVLMKEGIVDLTRVAQDGMKVRASAGAASFRRRKTLEACLAEAEGLGIKSVFALTQKSEFFKKFGFNAVDKKQLPQKIWNDCSICSKFAKCDEVAYIKEL